MSPDFEECDFKAVSIWIGMRIRGRPCDVPVAGKSPMHEGRYVFAQLMIATDQQESRRDLRPAAPIRQQSRLAGAGGGDRWE
jgi:hypothetical protein